MKTIMIWNNLTEKQKMRLIMRKFKFHIDTIDLVHMERFILPTIKVGRVIYEDDSFDIWIDLVFWKWELCFTYRNASI